MFSHSMVPGAVARVGCTHCGRLSVAPLGMPWPLPAQHSETQVITGSFTVEQDGDLSLDDPAILKDFQSTKLTFTCGISILLDPLVSFPLCLFSRANCH